MDVRCWVLGAEILEVVAREGFTEKVTFQWRAGGSEGASYKAMQRLCTFSICPSRSRPPFSTQLRALVG